MKSFKRISFLQIFLDDFMEAAGSDGNSINNVVNKYNEIKDNLNKYCSSDKLNEKTARLDNSFYGAARMIESRIISSYMKLKNIDPITEYGKNNSENSLDKKLLSFVKRFANDFVDCLISSKNSNDKNYISSLLNMDADTLSNLYKSFFNDIGEFENYFLENYLNNKDNSF